MCVCVCVCVCVRVCAHVCVHACVCVCASKNTKITEYSYIAIINLTSYVLYMYICKIKSRSSDLHSPAGSFKNSYNSHDCDHYSYLFHFLHLCFLICL